MYSIAHLSNFISEYMMSNEYKDVRNSISLEKDIVSFLREQSKPQQKKHIVEALVQKNKSYEIFFSEDSKNFRFQIQYYLKKLRQNGELRVVGTRRPFTYELYKKVESASIGDTNTKNSIFEEVESLSAQLVTLCATEKAFSELLRTGVITQLSDSRMHRLEKESEALKAEVLQINAQINARKIVLAVLEDDK